MTDYDKILTSHPLNKTAALVTQQNTEYEGVREQLLSDLLNIHKAIKTTKGFAHASAKRLELHHEKLEIEKKLSAMKDEYKLQFIRFCKQEITHLQYKQIQQKAWQEVDKKFSTELEK